MKVKEKQFATDFVIQTEKEISEVEIVEEQLPGEQPFKEIEVEPLSQSQKELSAKQTDLTHHTAILESWRTVEQTVDYFFSTRGIDNPESVQSVVSFLDYDPYFPPQLVFAYKELELLRNRAEQSGGNVSANEARKFITLADRFTYALAISAEMNEFNANPPEELINLLCSIDTK